MDQEGYQFKSKMSVAEVQKSQDRTSSLLSSSLETVSALELSTTHLQSSELDLEDLMKTIEGLYEDTFDANLADTGLKIGYWDADSQDGDYDYEDGDDGDDNELHLLSVTPDTDRQMPLNADKAKRPAQKPAGNDAGNKEDKQIVPGDWASADDEEYLNSDEEQEVLREIRDEIQQQVRAEMQSELNVYKEKMAALENGQLPDVDIKHPSNDQDPRIKEGLVKMEKLDRILRKRINKENQVKRDRILLERRIREEILQLKSQGRELRDVQVNTAKFLALTLPPSHNEGVIVDDPDVEPVFKTQIDHNHFEPKKSKKDKIKEPVKKNGIRANSALVEDGEGQRTGSVKSSSRESTVVGEDENQKGYKGRRQRAKKKTDFIKRNIELAANADYTVAMTEDEKKRLTDLLADLDSIPEALEGESSMVLDPALNPYQICVQAGEGFMPSGEEMKSLSHIDSRLKQLMPAEDFQSIASTPTPIIPEHKLFTRVAVRSELEFESYGERALLETKEEREMKEKLKRIEEQLSTFNNPDELELTSPEPLSEIQMQDLLNQCVNSLSQAGLITPIDTQRSDTASSMASSRLSYLENPPRLSQEILQQLLSEAHVPLIRNLADLKEVDDEGDECTTDTIQVETWRAIAEATADSEEALLVDPSSFCSDLSPSALDGPSLLLQYEQDEMSFPFSHTESALAGRLSGERLVLPEISKSPYLITQGIYNSNLIGSLDRQSTTPPPIASCRDRQPAAPSSTAPCRDRQSATPSPTGAHYDPIDRISSEHRSLRQTDSRSNSARNSSFSLVPHPPGTDRQLSSTSSDWSARLPSSN